MDHLQYISKRELNRIVTLDIDKLTKTRLVATCCRLNTLYMIAKAGSGHIGSSFSSTDIFTHLYLNVLQPEDIFFSSKGHDVPGLYSVLIALGLLDFNYLHQLRRYNGLPGHPDVSTPNIATNTGSLGMGIAKGKGMILANRLENNKGKVYVLTGDGELQEGQNWESLVGAANNEYGELTIIVDHNKVQSDTWVEKVSDLGDLTAKFSSFGWHVESCNGNDIHDFARTIEKVEKINNKPKVIIANTIKGFGVSFMHPQILDTEKHFYSYHSGAPSIEDYNKALHELKANIDDILSANELVAISYESMPREVKKLESPQTIQRLIPAYEKALYNQGIKNNRIVVLDADLMLDCGLLKFKNNFPERFVECGIAEQDMVSQAGGLALKGFLPIVHSFACFLSTRPNEQIYNNASEKTKCIYIGSLAGILPGGPGHSHQSVRDISALGGIPGLILIEPSCETEVEQVLNYAIDQNKKSTYIRLITIPYEIPFQLPHHYQLAEGQGVPLTEGKDAILFAYGPVFLSEAYKAASILKERYNFGLKVVNLPWLNKIDKQWLNNELKPFDLVFTMDNHLLTGGQGQMILSAIAELGLAKKVRQFGFTDIPKCGQNKEILNYYQLDAHSLSKRILQLVHQFERIELA